MKESTKTVVLDKPKEQNSYYQQNPKNFDELVELINAHPGKYSLLLNAKGRKREPDVIPPYKHLNDWVNEVTAFALADSFYSTPTKCYWILHDLHDFPKCAVCSSQQWYKHRNIHLWDGYHRTCSLKCRQNDELTKQHRIDAFQKKYGVDNPWQAEEIKLKCDATREERYGDKKFTNRQKAKKTREKHKQENPYYQEEIEAKKVKTFLKKYGCRNSAQCPAVMSKAHRKYKYNGMMFDSSIEVAYYIWMVDRGERIERASTSFQFNFNGKIYQYFPDFYLPDYQQYIELKGSQFFKTNDGTMSLPWRYRSWTNEQYMLKCQKEEAKHQCMLKNNVKIILQPSEELDAAFKHIKSKYGKNYLKQFRYHKK